MGHLSGDAPHACDAITTGWNRSKLVADQLGHGVGVQLDVYTIAALDQRQRAVEALEVSLLPR
jgi:hypothetical protein